MPELPFFEKGKKTPIVIFALFMNAPHPVAGDDVLYHLLLWKAAALAMLTRL
jgi:hypothetical protein